jgi:DNA-binding LacI/PurR family transcriptional regulator
VVNVGSPAAGPSGRPTLEMVAAVAGVSRGTASRALNGGANVSAASLVAVRRAAEKLGYRPNMSARSLALGRTDSVGLVVSETDERLFADPFFAAVVRGVHAELTAAGMQLVLTFSQSNEERAQVVRSAVGRHLDGVLLISVHGNDPLPESLVRAGIPVVMAGRGSEQERRAGVWWVEADNVGGSRSAVEHLVAIGRRRIATVAGPADMTVSRDRIDGWRQALCAVDLDPDPALLQYGDFSELSGRIAAHALLDEAPDVDAVFAASDLMAIGAMQALRVRGRRVPQDVAVIGFDNAAAAARHLPPLTTVDQSVELIGRLMARMLVHRIDGRPVNEQHVVLPTRLVLRETA